MPRPRPRPNYRDLEVVKPITRVLIEVIPHLAQRYETCGDWFRTLDANDRTMTLHIYTSKLDSEYDPYNFMAMCVAYHELGEALACIANNITEQQVDNWDLNYPGEDPGDDDEAPYVQQHRWASSIEKSLVVAMNMLWTNYERAINRLWNGKKEKM